MTQKIQKTNKSRSRIIGIAIIAVLALTLVACGGSDSDDLNGTSWELASLHGKDPIPETRITIEFAEDEVSGSGGCNHYGGAYIVSGDSLTFSDLFWTEMGCMEPPGILEQEMAFLAALQEARSYSFESDLLEIYDEGGDPLLVFTP